MPLKLLWREEKALWRSKALPSVTAQPDGPLTRSVHSTCGVAAERRLTEARQYLIPTVA